MIDSAPMRRRPYLALRRRTVLTAGIAAAGTLLVPDAVRAAPRPPSARDSDPPIRYTACTGSHQWRAGQPHGVRVLPGRRAGITIGHPAGTTSYTDPYSGTTGEWEYATWTSPSYPLGFAASELVASWNADTPPDTWLQVELHGTYSDGSTTPWYVMGRWAYADGDVKRTSVDGQQDPYAGIYTDTFAVDADDAAAGIGLVSYRLRATLYRTPGSRTSPRLFRLGAFASTIPPRFEVPASVPGLRRQVELRVPRYSQQIHAGQYPEYDNGGEAWCSPTSVEMLIEYWGKRPTAAQLAWVDPAYADPQVDYAARYTYDYAYEGTGNWPFNAAYAAAWGGLDAIVTQLGSLNDAERLVARGIPVVCSLSFYDSELDGAGYSSAGHLLDIIGFTAGGDVIVNDPFSPRDDAVRHVYDRRQFETVWLRTQRHLTNGKTGSGSGGVVYLIKPFHLPWPAATPGRPQRWGD